MLEARAPALPQRDLVLLRDVRRVYDCGSLAAHHLQRLLEALENLRIGALGVRDLANDADARTVQAIWVQVVGVAHHRLFACRSGRRIGRIVSRDDLE